MKDRKLLIGAVILVVAALLVTYLVFVREKARQRQLAELASEPIDSEVAAIEDKSKGEREVQLFFYNPDSVNRNEDFLKTEVRTLFEVEEPVLMARQILRELMLGPEGSADDPSAETEAGDRRRTVPSEAVLRQAYLLEDGTLVLDFSREGLTSLAGGITSEMAFIYSITRSIRKNIEEIKRIRFAIEGKLQPTLAGHISIAEPFR
jgi:hypothetical protein